MWDGRYFKCSGCGEIYPESMDRCPCCHAKCFAVPPAAQGTAACGDGRRDRPKRKVRDSDSPLESCRARDPMYCPYHGVKKMTRMLQDEFTARGIRGAVEVTKEGSHFKVSFRVDAQDESAAVAIVDNLLMTKEGVKKISNKGYETENDGIVSRMEAEGKIEREHSADRVELMKEWVENVVDRIDEDPLAKRQLRRCDFMFMLEKISDLYSADDARQKNPSDANLAAAVDQAYESAKDAMDVVCAMIDYSSVNTVDDAKAIADGYEKSIAEDKARYALAYERVRKARVASLGGTGTFPVGFRSVHPWAGVEVVSSLSDFSDVGWEVLMAQREMKAAYGAVAEVGKTGSDALGYEETKSLRVALQRLAAAADRVADHARQNEENADEFIACLLRFDFCSGRV